jgi:hypothetical protein
MTGSKVSEATRERETFKYVRITDFVELSLLVACNV